jgi:hypothetical protein
MVPPSQRIVWLYKRWQPLYDEISKTVVPRVEFVRGIPSDLDGDHYFDPRIRNVSLGRPDVDRGQGPENQRSLYRGKSSPKR